MEYGIQNVTSMCQMYQEKTSSTQTELSTDAGYGTVDQSNCEAFWICIFISRKHYLQCWKSSKFVYWDLTLTLFGITLSNICPLNRNYAIAWVSPQMMGCGQEPTDH